jgi:hypothetical protein
LDDLGHFCAEKSLGQRAWSFIKKSAADQRQAWLEVGEALLEGKNKANREVGQKFSEWVQEMFPGLDQTHASDAIWYAENSNMVLEIPEGITHPQNIRKAFNEQTACPAPSPELTLEAPSRLAASIER